MHKVTTVIFDKTGTITKGKPELVDYIGKNRSDDLQILASLEKQSEHPLAEAIVNSASKENIQLQNVSSFKMIAWKGVEWVIADATWYAGNIKLMDDIGAKYDLKDIHTLTSQGKTPIFLATDKEVKAIFWIADTIKDNVKEAIAELHRLWIKSVMLTGDNKQTAEHIASLVWIDDVRAEVLPQQKADVVRSLKEEWTIVAMCGDGVNDAPALAEADIGIAMGTGTDVAIETADITLLAGDISKLVKAMKLSRKTMTTIKQNLFWAFIYNIVWIPLAAGLFYPLLLNPIFAGLAMAMSSVSVVINSLRLKKATL
jgi:Cu+-exporting ATPase